MSLNCSLKNKWCKERKSSNQQKNKIEKNNNKLANERGKISEKIELRKVLIYLKKQALRKKTFE